ncbi:MULTISPECIES: type I restriction endonuclease subunit R [unclassified Planococcus (in: firmicutes)]|uniref:type I restriction endonuclease subunit R n=1 Tax=unclassified Planococcus (in: firmicutes) TaxID=2662419 RepID=UPI000C32A5A8|nr:MULTISPECIES: type I restriction endonuclease subunit R [unclassified Planococcus (in: firmicutes)]AUD13078.1 DEAD/DEAH box helicase [Planococcus sp. MB-3u-03]PKG45438.1 DEAD/DEAH box helicase [Planococcus sp. Urea-trap-24]PKG88966.1 DEAD/DEAH box helicase [Planococcus sp. Urea-3u-39]PKH36334.1 DEAD/DEAH box helicase [Planococcus sp. MB-3u-09]
MEGVEAFNEEFLELAAIEVLQELGYDYIHGPELHESGMRKDYREVIIESKLRDALGFLNPGIPGEAIEEAYRRIVAFPSPALIENNREFHELLVDGIDVTFRRDGEIRTEKVFIVDFENITRNDFLVVNQFTVIEHENRRPDLLVFVNGLPLVVIELKNLSDEAVGVEQAYNQIQTYKTEIPSLFRYNAFSIISDGLHAKAGTVTSNLERFMNWRTIDGDTVEPLDTPQYEVMLRGLLEPSRFLDVVRNFTLFQETRDAELDANGRKIGERKSIIKIMAAYHQYYAVKKAVENTKQAVSAEGDRKIGVIWHTQGSGKSFSMVFYTGALVTELNNPTIVVVTDRNDLDDQLFNTFAKSADLLRQEPKQADVRKLADAGGQAGQNGLYDLLNEREAGGIIFTTIQKFAPIEGEMPALTDRRNVIVIVDEAHRSQYGFDAKTNLDTGEQKFGYAKYLRDALPNASFIGFTGTPIEFEDKSTPAVFGNYIDIYDMTQAVEDEATVKIYYENRIIRLDVDDAEWDKIDEAFEEIVEGHEDTAREKYKSQWSRLEAVVGSPNRLKMLAKDIVEHYETKSKSMAGKAMIVTMSRKIAVRLYDEIIGLRPEWHSDDVDKGVIKVVMTGSASDEENLQKHTGGKQRRDTLANRMKDPADELQLVIVRDMWLTGFDVPSMHTMYIDKPMKGHNLMQAITRVNRVFKDKPGGAIVDYLGIFESLKKALRQYTDKDRQTTGIDTDAAIRVLQEKLEVLQGMFHRFDYSAYMGTANKDRAMAIIGGMNYVLGMPEEEQKDFKQVAMELAKAHVLVSATPEGIEVKPHVDYFKSVRATLQKLGTGNGTKRSRTEIEARVDQLLEKSIISQDVVDVFDSLGIEQPDVSILSEQFLEEIRHLQHKNVAVEMLKKLLDGKLKVMERSNLVKSERYSEKLQRALQKYRNQGITNVEVIEELIRLAYDIKKEDDAENELGLNKDEVAFYTALTDNEKVNEMMGDETLIKIAQELTSKIRANVSVDWTVRKDAQAAMRRLVKRLLKEHGYPPFQQKVAVETVLRQAELMSTNVSDWKSKQRVSDPQGSYID